MWIMSLIALLFLLMALGAFRDPRHFLRPLEIEAATPTARNEIQAVYGGFGLAMATVLLLPHALPDLRSGIAVTVGAALAGMALGRLIALARERPGRWAGIFLGVEILGASALFWVA